MWKVLLVEDDVYVRESIKEMVDWTRHGFSVVGEAGNGREALEIMKETSPDLVITDILMPLMDGVELLQQAKTHWPDCYFIMLSCVNDFEYVRKAMEYGASHYLLKLDMDVEALQKALNKAKGELLKRTGRKVREMERYYQKVWDMLNVKGRSEGTDFSELPMDAYRELHVTVFSILGGTPVSEERFWDCSILMQDAWMVLHSFYRYGITTFFCWSDHIPRFISDGRSDWVYPIVYSKTGRARELPSLWKAAIVRLNRLWYEGKKGIFYSGSDMPSDSYQGIAWEEEHDMIRFFEQMNKEACRKQMVKLWGMMEEQTVPLIIVKETAKRWNQLFSRIANQNDAREQMIMNATSHQQLKTVMLEYVERYMHHLFENSEKKSEHEQINRVIHFLELNYHQPITLKAMAKQVSMNENYLSRLFAKETGYSFIEYLHHVRIEHAARYLEETDLTVNEIGQKVGFVNNNYFIKIFKRKKRMTPNEYRKKVHSSPRA